MDWAWTMNQHWCYIFGFWWHVMWGFKHWLLSNRVGIMEGNSAGKAVEKLDVEDEETRHRRIRMPASKHSVKKKMLIYCLSYDPESYLEKLNSSSHTTVFEPVLKKFDFGDRTTFSVKPPTERMFHSTIMSFISLIFHSPLACSGFPSWVRSLKCSFGTACAGRSK